jgi:type IV pilus assembly protein PilB
MFTDDQLQEILLSAKITVDKNAFADLLKKAEGEKQKLENYLIANKITSEQALYEGAADYFKIPFVNLKKQLIRQDILTLIPEITAREHKIIAFDKDDQKIKVAASDPNNLEILEFIGKKTNLEPEINIATPSGIEDALKQYRKDMKSEFKVIEEGADEKKGKGKKAADASSELPIIKIIDTLLEQAFYENASDIHIEPAEKETTVRYRIDGIMANVMTLPKTAHASLLARIKVLSNLKVDEHRLPQDGRFKIVQKGNKISFRVSIIPTLYGEKVVMRLLEEKPQVLNLEQIGFQPQSLELVKKNIKKPHGMILVTGPTGSGKTTTLYTVLNMLNSPKVNISTIEDPIEYSIPRVNQSQVNPKIGYTFASGLRALLRQDPNIIMVGEIRDNETAEIAIHAALTGHLVLSTLHTNDALTTLPRLLEMNVPSFLVASTTNLIIAQRLVRKICRECIQSYYLDKDQLEQLKKQIDVNKIMATLQAEKIVSEEEKNFEKLLFYKGKGCAECGNTGYKGRTGIYETLAITPALSILIAKGAPEDELRAETEKQAMLKMIEDGFIKAKNGITTIEEVLRVTKE